MEDGFSMAAVRGDRILRATGERAEVRIVLVDATSASNRIATAHGAEGFSRQLLGESIASSLLLASRLKGPGTVQLRFSFSGDITRLAADATPMGLVRAMIPQEEIRSAGSFEPLVMPQTLTVRKLDRNGASLAEGIVETEGLDLSSGITHYLHQSEQGRALLCVSSRCRESGERLRFAGGFLLEAFPGLSEVEWNTLETAARAIDLESLALADAEGLSLRDLFSALTRSFPAQVHQEFGVEPYCPCSEAGVLRALSGLGRDELEGIYFEGQETELFCEFCRKRYTVTPEQIYGLLGGETEEG